MLFEKFTVRKVQSKSGQAYDVPTTPSSCPEDILKAVNDVLREWYITAVHLKDSGVIEAEGRKLRIATKKFHKSRVKKLLHAIAGEDFVEIGKFKDISPLIEMHQQYTCSWNAERTRLVIRKHQDTGTTTFDIKSAINSTVKELVAGNLRRITFFPALHKITRVDNNGHSTTEERDKETLEALIDAFTNDFKITEYMQQINLPGCNEKRFAVTYSDQGLSIRLLKGKKSVPPPEATAYVAAPQSGRLIAAEFKLRTFLNESARTSWKENPWELSLTPDAVNITGIRTGKRANEIIKLINDGLTDVHAELTESVVNEKIIFTIRVTPYGGLEPTDE